VQPRNLYVPPQPPTPGTITPAPPKPRALGLRTSVRRDRRHHRIDITVNCATECKLNAYLMTRRRGKPKFHTQTRTQTRAFKSGRFLLHLSLPAHVAKLRPVAQVIVVATDRSGTSTRVSRNVRLT
jgi:hypothetical protein